MSELYTPTSSYGTDPVTILTDGDPIDATQVFSPVKISLDRALYNKDTIEETTGRLNALTTKLGISVTDPSDVTLPTYTSGYLLVGNISTHNALEILDSGLQTQNNVVVNVYTNIGGNSHTASKDAFSSNNFISNSDTYHVAIGKLDDGLGTVDAAASSANTLATQNTTRISNIVTKIGTDADLGTAWTYDSTNFIANGQTLKVNVEEIDKSLLGPRRNAHRAFQYAMDQELRVTSIEETLTNAEIFYDDFYDATQKDVTSTCTLDIQHQECRGDNTFLLEIFTATTTQDQVKMVWTSLGGVTVKANLIGSTADVDFTTISSQNTWFDPSSGNGTSVVVKIELGVGAELYNFHIITKP